LITKGLGASSSQLRDVAGNRLFATFTRFQLNSTAPMTAYAENEPIAIEAKISRYGAGMFFNDATLQGDGKSARVRLMSNFSKFDETAANTSLLTGQPQIAADCKIPTLPDLPEFGQQYRAQRSVPLEPPIFECGYDIVASHDINGVGLLYFAAYPIINDICALRYAGPALSAYSTRCRDVFYFANCEADDSLIYRIHRWRASDDSIEAEESLSRKSDGTLMAYTRTIKDRTTKQVAIRERTTKDRSAA
jgi:probable biosynthetic protein (TIGR04098 family)